MTSSSNGSSRRASISTDGLTQAQPKIALQLEGRQQLRTVRELGSTRVGPTAAAGLNRQKRWLREYQLTQDQLGVSTVCEAFAPGSDVRNNQDLGSTRSNKPSKVRSDQDRTFLIRAGDGIVDSAISDRVCRERNWGARHAARRAALTVSPISVGLRETGRFPPACVL